MPVFGRLKQPAFLELKMFEDRSCMLSFPSTDIGKTKDIDSYYYKVGSITLLFKILYYTEWNLAKRALPVLLSAQFHQAHRMTLDSSSQGKAALVCF